MYVSAVLQCHNVMLVTYREQELVTIVAIYQRDNDKGSYEIICVTNLILKRKNLNVPRVVSWVNPPFGAALCRVVQPRDYESSIKPVIS